MLPISLYIHIPWCVKKCPYCDFNSHNKPENIPFEKYFQDLFNDFKQNKHVLNDRAIHTIFIGGGTPSLADPKFYQQLLQNLKQECVIPENIEITMELNPGTYEYHNLEEYFLAGINRISIGAQSFNNQSLQNLGRIHQKEHTLEVIKQLSHKNFNIDLMHTLPGQSLEEALVDLKTAINLNAPHISWYQLTIEENTYFAKHKPILPSEKLAFAIYQQGLELLQKSGYEHYEVSAFTKNKQYCQHNLNYWQYGDYLGIGCGAHSKTTSAGFIITRSNKVKNPYKYMDNSNNYTHHCEIISPQQLPFEFFMNAARLIEGFNLELFTKRTNLPITAIESQLRLAENKQLITINNNNLKLSEYGKLFVNDLVEMFL